MNICELLENSNSNPLTNEESINLTENTTKEEEDEEEETTTTTTTNETQQTKEQQPQHQNDGEHSSEPEMFALFSDVDVGASANSNMIFTDSSSDSSDSQNSSTLSYILSGSSGSGDDEFNFDRLGPFEKLCSLCDNPTPSNMESASKFIVPALEFCANQDDYVRAFSYLKKFCFFPDILLRSLWLEQIQNVIQYVHLEGENIPIEFKDFNMTHELAMLISSLMQEPTYQVKKYATASLLCIIERRLLDNNQIESLIIPSLLNLVKENNEDFHIDCVSLFGKLAPLIGRDLTTKYFLEPFCRLCSSPVFHTRKACASNITEMANIVMMEEVEKYLLPHFCDFMKDQVWAIRKVCADMFSQFASKCSRKTREQVLTEHFIRLLDDNSRWVKISAYKSLGSFIATFSKDPNEIEEDNNKKEQVEEKEENKKSQQEESIELSDINVNQESNESVKTEQQVVSNLENLNISNDTKSVESQDTQKQEETNQTTNQDSEYSNFMYWRNSLPNLEDNINKSETDNQTSSTETLSKKEDTTPTPITSSPTSSSNETNKLQEQIKSQLYASTSTLVSYSSIVQQSLQNPSNRLTDLNLLSEDLKQDIVPPILLSYFVTMVEMNAQNGLDGETNYNCAFNFPAIVLTLGKSNWKYVRNLYKKLSEDNLWKVRQTLAYSIHEIAFILGSEITQSELVPVFDSFIKDVDEVRMGIVANLSKFLRILSLDHRKSYMPKLNDFLKMDNQRNWRFRNELGLQIAEFCELFPIDCIAEFIQPVTFTLALDKVAEVRITAVKALTRILMQFELNPNEPFCKNYRRNFVDDVIRTFANNNKWSFRQLYVMLCDFILKERAYSDLNEFCVDFLPKLFSFRNDRVPNIRVCLAKVISNHMLNSDYFMNENTQISNELEITLQYLSGDRDEDVQSYVKFAKSPTKSFDDKTTSSLEVTTSSENNITTTSY